MANTSVLNGVAGQNFVRCAGLFTVTVTMDDTYATPAGFTIDLTDVLALAPAGISFANCGPEAYGMTTAGWKAIAVKGTTSAQYTVTLWNGITEFSDGAVTGTLILFVPIY